MARCGRLADHVIEHGIDGPGPYPRGPRPGPAPPAADRRRQPAGAPSSRTARRDRSTPPVGSSSRSTAAVLPIQGPPGTGKTYTAARMILDLVEEGSRVGVTAQSHRVIEQPARGGRRRPPREAGPSVRIAHRRRRRRRAPDAAGIERIRRTTNGRGGLAARRPGTSSAARAGSGRATTWPDASTCCSSTRPASCRSRPSAPWPAPRARSCCWATRTSCRRSRRAPTPRAPRPRRSSTSLARRRRSPPDRGLLLGTTYRLHPDVNAFISDAFYEGRLATDAGERAPGRRGRRAGRRHGDPARADRARGTRPTAPRRRRRGSPRRSRRFVGRPWTDAKGRRRDLDRAPTCCRRAVQRPGRRDRPGGA